MSGLFEAHLTVGDLDRAVAFYRDVAFTADAGYAAGLEIDGIGLRDRVWLDRELTTAPVGTQR